MTDRKDTFSLLQIVLHWLIAILIVLAYFSGDGMGRVLRDRIEQGWTGFEGNTPHVWVGGAIFALVLLRITTRLINGAPPPVPGTSAAMERAARAGHLLLYVLMVAVPTAGVTTWYLKVPAAGDVHDLLANGLMLVALGHALVAIVHEVRKPGSMIVRMIRPR